MSQTKSQTFAPHVKREDVYSRLGGPTLRLLQRLKAIPEENGAVSRFKETKLDQLNLDAISRIWSSDPNELATIHERVYSELADSRRCKSSRMDEEIKRGVLELTAFPFIVADVVLDLALMDEEEIKRKFPCPKFFTQDERNVFAVAMHSAIEATAK